MSGALGKTEMLPQASRNVVRAVVINLGALGFPLLAAIVCIPVLLARTGETGFAVISSLWVLLAYFEFVDGGAGRALSKLISSDQHRRPPDLDKLTVSALCVALCFSVACGILALALLQGGTFDIFNEPQSRTALSICVLAAPFVSATGSLKSGLEAHHHFGLAVGLRVPVVVSNFVVPLIIVDQTGPSLVAVALALLAVRVAAFAIYVAAYNLTIVKIVGVRPNTQQMRQVFSFGCWIAASNVIGPTMFYADRLVAGIFLSAAALAQYNATLEILTKALAVPAAIVTVVFPMFAALASCTPLDAERFLRRVVLTQAAVFVVIAVTVAALARPLLSAWIDPQFAADAALIVVWLAPGLVFAATSTVLQAFVQAHGRPDLTTKLQLVELPLFLVYLSVLTLEYGIHGTAVAWSLRFLLGSIGLGVLVRALPRNPTQASA